MAVSHKLIFMSCLLAIVCIGSHCVFADEVTKGNESNEIITKANCSCGGYPKSNPEKDSQPLLSQVLSGLIVNSDQEGENTCKTLCLALATATKAKGPDVICNRLVNADELTISVFHKIGDHPWTYSGMTAEEPLCCENSKSKICPSMLKTNNPFGLVL